MDQRIKDLIDLGGIWAIAVDTNIFESKKFNLESGLLARVAQFADSSVDVLLPEVIASEVVTHMRAEGEKAQTALKGALKLARAARLDKSGQPLDAAEALARSSDLANTTARRRMDLWIERTGATVLRAGDYVSIDDVMERYFNAEPPFAVSGPKKHEFPDAVALMTLEHWAKQRDGTVIVVSNDGDCERYCERSERLELVRDLAEALGAFQPETASYAAWRLGELVNQGDPMRLNAAVLASLANWPDKVQLDVTAVSGSLAVEHEFDEIEFDELIWPASGTERASFTAVDHQDGTVAVRVKLKVRASVTSHFRFRAWDGIDRDHVDLGSGSFESEQSIPVRVIITVGGDIPDRMEIEDIEILPVRHAVELGEIEPSWMSDPILAEDEAND